MLIAMLLAAAFQPAAAEPTQRIDPLACTAQPNFVTKERFPLSGSSFRFSGTVTADAMEMEDFTPFASVALLQQGAPEELTAVLSVHPHTRSRYDVTLRRHINNELRERSIVGRVPNGSVRFELAVTPGRDIVFRLGELERRVPMRDFRPDAIVLGCSSGTFRFDNLTFSGGTSS